MEKYYHYTSMNSFNKIIYEGLIPQNGFRCQSIGDNDTGVFLSKGMKYSIVMYANMLSYYQKVNGEEGYNRLEFYRNKINHYEQILSKNPNERICSILYELRYEYDFLNNMRNMSFIDFLGGPGYYLLVEGINGIEENEPSNCVYRNVIPPSNIKIVNLRNIYSNERNYSRESIISYFTHIIPLNNAIEGISLEEKTRVQKLYEYTNNKYLINYSPNYYEIDETPISCYNQDFSKLSIKQKH